MLSLRPQLRSEEQVARMGRAVLSGGAADKFGAADFEVSKYGQALAAASLAGSSGSALADNTLLVPSVRDLIPGASAGSEASASDARPDIVPLDSENASEEAFMDTSRLRTNARRQAAGIVKQLKTQVTDAVEKINAALLPTELTEGEKQEYWRELAIVADRKEGLESLLSPSPNALVSYVLKYKLKAGVTFAPTAQGTASGASGTAGVAAGHLSGLVGNTGGGAPAESEESPAKSTTSGGALPRTGSRENGVGTPPQAAASSPQTPTAQQARNAEATLTPSSSIFIPGPPCANLDRMSTLPQLEADIVAIDHAEDASQVDTHLTRLANGRVGCLVVVRFLC